MISLYMYPPAFELRNASPFCLKVEMALCYLDFDYDVELLADPRKAPKGKLPFIETDGRRLADSELILEYLDQKSGGRLFGELTEAEFAQGIAFTRLSEEHLYWFVVASRWLDDDWWPNVRTAFFGAIPGMVRAIVAPMVRRQLARAYRFQGLGRHSLSEQKRFASRDLQAINNTVDNSRFIAGPRMTVFDFAVAAQLACLLDNQPSTWTTRLSSEFPALRDYAERIQDATGVFARG